MLQCDDDVAEEAGIMCLEDKSCGVSDRQRDWV